MFIPDPGSRILIFTHPGSRIPDLGSRIQKQQQKREVTKKFVLIIFFCSYKSHIIEYFVIFEMLKKKIWTHFQRSFYSKNFSICSEIYGLGIQDPISGIRDGLKSGSGIQDPQHYYPDLFNYPESCFYNCFR